MEFGLLAAVAMAALGTWLTLRVVGADLHVDAPGAADRLLTATLVGVLVGRLQVVIGSGVRPWEHPFDVLLVRGGVATTGATIGAVTTLLWAYRSHLPAALDALATPIAIGLAGWHLGCIPQGTCWGVAAPWGGRHPVELYAAAGLAAVGWLAHRCWRRAGAGMAGAVALVGVAGVRLITEVGRLRLGSGRLWFYAIGVVAGVCLLTVAQYRQRATPQHPPADQ